eukprot:4391983-Amphidinium_carterae.1
MANNPPPPMATPVDRKKPQFRRQHMVRDGRYSHNRRGLELCKGFQLRELLYTHGVRKQVCQEHIIGAPVLAMPIH